jgi:predicted nucleic acid-binding protein
MVQRIRPDGLAISVITYGEVWEGVLYSANRPLNTARWRSFVAGVDVLAVTLPVAELWGDLRGLLRSTGRRLDDNDLLIAATAMELGLCLVSRNVKHFARVPGLDLLVPDF